MDFIIFKKDPTPTLILQGRWTLEHLSTIEQDFNRLSPQLPKSGTMTLDCNAITTIDTAAMLFFIEMRQTLKAALKISAMGISPTFRKLFKTMLPYYADPAASALLQPSRPGWLYQLGKKTADGIKDLILFLDFIGRSTVALYHTLISPRRFRLNELSANLQNVGVMALPIITLSAVLIGIVIAFQSAVQLKNYGANIFIVDMLGISLPRELSPLITAIVVAGRSASAFTAQIGAMRVTEELDAMKTLGFDPYHFVILPRILATIIALPLLIFFADVIGIYAGMIVSQLQLNISPAQFLERMEEAVSVRHYVIGLIKGPFFAFAISSIGCFRGLQVSKNTQSIGRYTTISVVNSIFMVIFIDAIFSVILTELDL